MNRGPAAWHRVSVAVVGLLLLVVGLAGVLSQADVHPVAGWIDRIDTDRVDRVADASWWTWILLAVVVVAVVWGLRLLRTLVRPHAAGAVVLDGSDASGRMTIAPGLIAGAVRTELAARSEFDAVSVKALDDRGATIVRITVTASPERDYADVSAVLADVVDDIREAVGDAGLHVQAMIHLDAPKRGRSATRP